MVHSNNQPWRIAIVAFALGAAWMGWTSDGGKQANADTRRNTAAEPEQHFKSGGRLAEGVLQEILVVLKRMDERLERIERTSRFVPGRGSAPIPATNDVGPGPAAELVVPEIKVKRPS